MRDDLEPLDPEKGVEMYLDHRKLELSKKSIQNHGYRLRRFVEWCEGNELDNLNELTGRKLHEYRYWRAQEIAKVSLVHELRTLQKVLEFWATIDGVVDGIREQVLIPTVSGDEEPADGMLEHDRAIEILRTWIGSSTPLGSM